MKSKILFPLKILFKISAWLLVSTWNTIAATINFIDGGDRDRATNKDDDLSNSLNYNLRDGEFDPIRYRDGIYINDSIDNDITE